MSCRGVFRERLSARELAGFTLLALGFLGSLGRG
jgi:hypothetical protein